MKSIFIFLGAGLAFQLALGRLWQPVPTHNRLKQWSAAGLFFCIAVVQFFFGLFQSWLILEYPHLLFLALPFGLLIGPLALVHFDLLMAENGRISRLKIAHLLPGPASIPLVLIPAFTMERADKLEFIQAILRDMGNPTTRAFYCFFPLLVATYVLVIIRKQAYLLHPRYLTQAQYLYPVLLSFFIFIITLTAGVGIILNARPVAEIAAVLVAPALLTVYLMEQRYPELQKSLGREYRRNRYSRSKLAKLDLEEIRRRLFHQMETEKVFTDEDLNLASLAQLLDISAHQLSEYVNHRLEKNFNTFLNEYRVREAQRLLVDEPDRTTLSVGLAVGFNSGSMFHSVFRRVTGKTPGAYRKHARSNTSGH